MIKKNKGELPCRNRGFIGRSSCKALHRPAYPYGVVKLFFLCTPLGGEFTENSETTERAYFSQEALPAPLAEEKVTREQLLLCFAAHADPDWVTQFD